jgi:hypothetical protein
MSATAQGIAAIDPSAEPARLKLSIVVPTYNEAGGIERLIIALDEAFTAHSLDGRLSSSTIIRPTEPA